MKVSAVKIDITPDGAIDLTGDIYRRRFAEKIHSPLYGRIMLIDDGERRIIIVALDITIVSDKPADKIRAALAEITGSIDNVMVHATQTHNAPSIGKFLMDESIPLPPEAEFMRGTADSYTSWVVEKVIENARKLPAMLREVKMFSGRAIEGRYSFNRRGVFLDNGIFMPLNGRWPTKDHPDEYLRFIEGPIDPEVGAIGFVDESGKTVAMILHHTCHPVCTFPQNIISSDWPGAWCTNIEKMFPEATALVVNGCCGNINPWNPYSPVPTTDCAEMGAALTDATKRIIERHGNELRDGKVAVDMQVLDIDFRKPEPEEIGNRIEYYNAHPDVEWTEYGKVVNIKWVLAANNVGLLNALKRRGKMHYGLQLFRIGVCVILGMPGEPFVEAQIKLKQLSPAALTMCVHNINQYVGYIPNLPAFDHPAGQRGHEGNFSTWSNLQHEALDIITDAAAKMIISN